MLKVRLLFQLSRNDSQGHSASRWRRVKVKRTMCHCCRPYCVLHCCVTQRSTLFFFFKEVSRESWPFLSLFCIFPSYSSVNELSGTCVRACTFPSHSFILMDRAFDVLIRLQCKLSVHTHTAVLYYYMSFKVRCRYLRLSSRDQLDEGRRS